MSLATKDGHTKLDGETAFQGDAVSGQDIQSLSVGGPKQPVNSHISFPAAPTAVPKRTLRRRVLGSLGLLGTRPLPKRISARDRKKLRYGRFIRATPATTSVRRLAGNWNDVKNLMVKVEANPRAAPRKVPKHKEILIPEETVGLLVGVSKASFGENIYFSSVRNGCRIHILPPSEGDGVHRRAILSGSEHASELVKDSIARAHLSQTNGDPLVEMAKPIVPIFASTLSMRQKNIPVPLVRGVWYTDREDSLSLDEVLEHRSSINSVKEFSEHIDDLTRVQRKSPKKTPGLPSVPCQQLVAREILALFKQEDNRTYLSTAALNGALEYLSKREMFATARDVFTLAEQVATVDTYNILLDSAARRQDKRAFRFFLHCMWRVHIRPNSLTWVKLLKAMVLPSHKASLINHMAQNGHMNDIRSIRSPLHLTIEDSFFVHLESGQGVESFIDLMVKTLGADWFSSSILAQMFAVIARLKDYNALEKLLKICTEHDLAIDSDSLTPIVGMFRGNVFNAIHHTVQLLKGPLFKLYRETYERLFLIAYKSRRYNICRVLWYYACMERKVTYKMRKAVLSSLTSNVSIVMKDKDIGRIWRTNAGKAIVGIEKQAQHPFPKDIIKALPAEFKYAPDLYLRTLQPMGPGRDLQLRLASCIINRDIERGVLFGSRHPLGVMLEAAAMEDREWAGEPRPLTWIMGNIIKIPLRFKRKV